MKQAIILWVLVCLMLLSGIILPSIFIIEVSAPTLETTIPIDTATPPEEVETTKPIANIKPVIPPVQIEPIIPVETIEPTIDPEIQKWEKRYEEYPVATTVWRYLTEDMGYSDYVAAGIIGNMMAECGGQTLELKWDAKNKSSGCYGLCQWHPRYYKEIQSADLDAQLEFMAISFPDVLSRYLSTCYKKGFTYEDFLAMEDPGEIAYAFCVTYERPGPGRYTQRRTNAVKAYEYFTSEGENYE
jgi:hypothetical protein